MAELPPWAPTTAAVAHHLKQMLKAGPGATPVEDFTDATPIRLVEADQAIVSVSNDVAAAVGDDESAGWPDDARLSPLLWDHAAAVVAIGAAAEAVVDRSNAGELYERLAGLYEARLKRLITAATDARDGTVDGQHTSVPATGCWPEPFEVDRTRF